MTRLFVSWHEMLELTIAPITILCLVSTLDWQTQSIIGEELSFAVARINQS